MKHHWILFSSIITTPLFLGGCALGPQYSRPAIDAPAAFKEKTETPESVVKLPSDWWTIFDDAELNTIEAQVVAANQNVRQAAARLREALALARLTEADFYPNVSLGHASTRFRSSGNRAGQPPGGLRAEDHVTQLELGYELDLWGRVRRTNEAARAEAAAMSDDFDVTLLSVTTEAARHYFELRALDEENRVLESTLALRRDALGLQTTRVRAGLINSVDVTRAQAELATIEVEIYAVMRRRDRIEHALAVLCGQTPAAFTVSPSNRTGTLPEIPVGLPSSLLQRRPDLAASEHLLEAACARIGVAKADFFPRISLTGALGFASADLGSLIEGDSRLWSFGPGIHLPIFEGGRNRANLAAAEARYVEAIAHYRGSVLNAFRQVEDALSDLGTLSAESAAANRVLLAARDTAVLGTERYERGLSGYLDVVDAQRAVLQAERLVTRLRSERILATIQLAEAVGGGWQNTVTFAQR